VSVCRIPTLVEPRGPIEAQQREDAALVRLMSLAQGERGFIDVVACGPGIVSKLRRLLWRRDSTGIYEPPCRVVEALALLRAREALIEFLDTDRDIQDPIERAGEDAVVNAVARARWTADGDSMIAVLGYCAALRFGMLDERHDAVRRLLGMLCRADWSLRFEIEESLVTSPDALRPLLAPLLASHSEEPADDRLWVLLRLARRIGL